MAERAYHDTPPKSPAIAPAKPRPRPATSVGKRVTLYALSYLPPDTPLITFNNSPGIAPIPLVTTAEVEAIRAEEAAPRNATAAAK
jgi:hypothetical protein